MKKTGVAIALKDYKYIHATGTGGIEIKVIKGKEYDVIDTGDKERVCVSRREGRVILAPSFHKERFTYKML